MGNRDPLLVVAAAKSAAFHGHFADVQNDRDRDMTTVEIVTMRTAVPKDLNAFSALCETRFVTIMYAV